MLYIQTTRLAITQQLVTTVCIRIQQATSTLLWVITHYIQIPLELIIQLLVTRLYMPIPQEMVTVLLVHMP